MKKGIWIIVTALLSLGAIIGANALVSTTNVNTMKKKLSAEEQIKIAPKAAVDSATVALKKALSQQNAPAVIAALVKQSAAQLLIDRDSLPAIIDKTPALADRSENPVEQSLLRLLTISISTEIIRYAGGTKSTISRYPSSLGAKTCLPKK